MADNRGAGEVPSQYNLFTVERICAVGHLIVSRALTFMTFHLTFFHFVSFRVAYSTYSSSSRVCLKPSNPQATTSTDLMPSRFSSQAKLFDESVDHGTSSAFHHHFSLRKRKVLRLHHSFYLLKFD